MPVQLEAYADLALGEDVVDATDQVTQLATGRVLFYQNWSSDPSNGLLVNADLTASVVLISPTQIDQVIALGNSGTTDYVGILRSANSGETGFNIELMSIDVDGILVSLDSVEVSAETEVYSEWAQPTTADAAFVPYDWFTGDPDPDLDWAERFVLLTRSGTTLSLGTPVDPGVINGASDAWYGSFIDSSHTGDDTAWVVDYSFSPPRLSRIDTTTLTIDASPAPPAGYRHYDEGWTHGGTASGPIAMLETLADTAQLTAVRWSSSGATILSDEYDSNFWDTRFVVDTTDHPYLLRNQQNVGGEDIHFFYLDGGEWQQETINRQTIASFTQTSNIVAFQDGVLLVGGGTYLGDLSNDIGPELWYYTYTEPPSPPENDLVENAIDLVFVADSVVEVEGTLYGATDGDGPEVEDVAHVWYKLVVPRGQHVWTAVQVDRPPGDIAVSELNYTLLYQYRSEGPIVNGDGGGGYTGGLDDNEDHPSEILTEPSDVLESNGWWEPQGVDGGDTLYIAVSRDTFGSDPVNTEFILRVAIYSIATDIPVLPAVSDVGPTVHTFFVTYIWEGSWAIEFRTMDLECDADGQLVFRYFDQEPDPESTIGDRPGAPSQHSGGFFVFMSGSNVVWAYDDSRGLRRDFPPGSPPLHSVPYGPAFSAEDFDLVFVAGQEVLRIDNFSGPHPDYRVVAHVDLMADTITRTWTIPLITDGSRVDYAVSGRRLVENFFTTALGPQARVCNIDTGVCTVTDLPALPVDSLSWTYVTLGTRSDGKIVLLKLGFSFFTNVRKASTGIVFDPVTLTTEDITFTGAPTAPAGMPALHQPVWGFGSDYVIHTNLGVTADRTYVAHGITSPSANWHNAGSAYWGTEFRSDVYRTNLFTGVTTLWFSFQRPETDIVGPDFATNPDSWDLRFQSFDYGFAGSSFPDSNLAGNLEGVRANFWPALQAGN